MTADNDLLAKRRSPLQHLADQLAAVGSPETVSLRELPYRTLIDLKGRATGPPETTRHSPTASSGLGRSAKRLEQALGVPLPGKPGEVSGGEGRQALWWGPAWWLISDEPDPQAGLEPALVGALREAAAGQASAVDVSAHFTTLELTGRHARAVLEHGCSADLHPRAFPVGSCAQTTLAKAQVTLHQTGARQCRIVVRASFADYLTRWLLDAMTEYVA